MQQHDDTLCVQSAHATHTCDSLAVGTNAGEWDAMASTTTTTTSTGSESKSKLEGRHDTVVVLTRNVGFPLRLPRDSALSFALIRRQLEQGVVEPYVNLPTTSLSAILDHAQGWSVLNSRRQRMLAYLNESTEKADDPSTRLSAVVTDREQISRWILAMQIAIYTAVAQISGPPPRRTRLSLHWPDDLIAALGHLSTAKQLVPLLEQQIGLKEMALTSPSGFVFDRENRKLSIRGAELVLRGMDSNRRTTKLHSAKALESRTHHSESKDLADPLSHESDAFVGITSFRDVVHLTTPNYRAMTASEQNAIDLGKPVEEIE